MRNKKGFTLVELLAVIVILAIILVIAVPKITSTIDSARKGSIESTLMMVAARAETEYLTVSTLDEAFAVGTESVPVACGAWANLDATQYTECFYYIDDNGEAHVKLNGTASGKFDNYTCPYGTRAGANCTKGS